VPLFAIIAENVAGAEVCDATKFNSSSMVGYK